MTIKHYIDLIKPRFSWFIKYVKDFVRQWKRLKATKDLQRMKRVLEERKLEYGRKNTEESLKYQFAVEKQIQLLDIILERHDGI